jgi:hypothetical protein
MTATRPREKHPCGGAEKLRFFLGGHDLEMVVVADLVRGECGAAALADKALSWGARASDYALEIARGAADGLRPVLVELAPDIALPEGTIEIDHHGEKAGGPCSLRQVFELLGLPEARWSRHFALVAANDTGHVAGMRAIGASNEEIATIRAADRRAQGIIPAEEDAGRAALAAARHALGGAVLVVHLPHGRSATVTDPLALAGDTAPEILVLMPGSVGYFGSGAAIMALDAAFPGGWRGGELPARGFWGIAGERTPEEAELLAVLAPGLLAQPAS